MPRKLITLALGFVLAASPLVAQTKTQNVKAVPQALPTSDSELRDTQQQLLKLLRTSPKLTTVVARDPSLLANPEYVQRNNPELAIFLESHPEIVRNPDYYLFTNLGPDEGRTEWALERRVWPEMEYQGSSDDGFISRSDVVPFLVFLCILGALLWLIRVLLENRRWSRIFKLQTDVHGKLIEKFGTSQELLTYMDTEAGKRFLEAAPIPVDFKDGQSIPSPIARILTPLQIGVVSTLIGVGFFIVRHYSTHATLQLLAFGTMFLMLGLGFIISAALTWALGKHLGLVPTKADESAEGLDGRQ